MKKSDSQKVLEFQQELLDWIRSDEGQKYIDEHYDRSTAQENGVDILSDLITIRAKMWRERNQ
jgi:hypothetical protein